MVRAIICLLAIGCASTGAAVPRDEGFVPLFNGKDLTGWRVPEGDNGHWRVADGVIDYDARSEARGSKDLWTEQEYGDFVLRLDWRIKETPATLAIPEILPDGSTRKDDGGKEITRDLPNADSGVYLRGTSKAQVNIWCWPIGSGEVWGYRTDQSMPPEVRAAVTPRVRADNPVGQWNTFEITMKGEELTVVLNGKTVIDRARLPGVPPRGRIALQHHGRFTDGKYDGASALVQFRNVAIRVQ